MTVTLSPDVYRKLQEKAAQGNRDVNDMADALLRSSLTDDSGDDLSSSEQERLRQLLLKDVGTIKMPESPTGLPWSMVEAACATYEDAK
ncbi:MAG: hypothetical protein OHK0029_16900 [Armatimonadaceae bacterium]